MKNKKLTEFLSAAAAVAIAISCISVLNVGAANEESYTGQGTITSSEQKTRALPEGSYRTDVNINGRRVLSGRVWNIDGVTYVPMFKFADWLGNFDYSSSSNYGIRSSRINGENLEITATENSLYISANGRYFYTGAEVLEIDGEIYVPIRPLVKALNCYVSVDNSGKYRVSSGDTRRLKNASQFYREDEVYWLSKIISAEARGESLEGKIAVGNVILNRVRSKQYPNTIYGVIFDRKYGVQFAPTANGTIYNSPTAESVIAAKICLEGYSLSNDIIYFVNPRYAQSSWISQNRPYAFTIGNHVFYK